MEKLTESLTASGVLRSPKIIEVFKKIDRRDFVPDDQKKYAYEDRALPIGYGQTISQPTTVAIMLELLDPGHSDKVLDVGSGSGWSTALLAALADRGEVYGVEIVPELAEFGRANLKKYSFNNANIFLAWETLGLPEYATFHKVLVSAASMHAPEELLKQLAEGGVMVAPVTDTLEKITKLPGGSLKTEKIEGFAFVPLIETEN